MTIDLIVPQVESIIDDRSEDADGAFFSYRHAEEMHALGLKHEIVSHHAQWTQVCLSVVITTMLTPKIWVRILWSRPKLEYPTEECPPWEFPISEMGVQSLEKQWPSMRRQLRQAVARGRPPEKSA